DAVPERADLPELIVTAELVARREQGAFYELLVERSAGLSTHERDYDYAGQLEKYWDSRDAEEALDYENDYKVSDPQSARLAAQQKYLAYLFDTHETNRARALVAEIEAQLKGRYARPVWLRLAALRLDVRAGRIMPAYAALRRLTGIEPGAHVNALKPPDTTRLNEAAALLTEEGHAREADQLRADAYTRALALAQYDAAYFAGLARLAFTVGDAARGRALLTTMLALAQEETRPAAEAELAAAAWLKPYAIVAPGVELPAAAYRINYNDALALVADTAAAFSQFELAVDCRQRLLALTPTDETNRIELVRLLAAANRREEALTNLAAIIADRAATRGARWQAVWLAPEIAADSEALTALRARVAAASKDSEMLSALEALALASAGRHAAACELAGRLDAESANAYACVFRALLAVRAGQTDAVLASLTDAELAGRSADAWPAFNLPETEQWRAFVRAYLAAGQTPAALRVAERDASLRPVQTAPEGPAKTDDVDEETAADAQTDELTHAADAQPPVALNAQPSVVFQTLAARARSAGEQARVALLGQLSTAAEQTGDLKLALAFERARYEALASGAARRASAERIARLVAAQSNEAAAPALTVDARFVAQR
ncbi:MAG TPA: hypothetical protein VE775_01745, partial [Pyrinomonadaceae bacterium]|nr:hypothetical protein [Pyrinomonadaceae bacterium]